jgi:hypothetical protein
MSTAGKHRREIPDKLSSRTKQLREKRRSLKRGGSSRDNIEYSETCKAIRIGMKEDLQAFHDKQILEAIENSKSLKAVRRKQCLGKSQFTSIKEEDGSLITDRDRIVKRCEEFYKKLYASRSAAPAMQQAPIATPVADDPPPILPSEVRASINRLNRTKAPGEDKITGGILQDGGEAIVTALTRLFNQCLHLRKLPSSWKNAVVILLHKKGDTTDIKNYRPISLLPIMYKVFSHILLRRMLPTLDFHQPREQAGFRAGFSTIDHLHVINQLQEKSNEYNIPLCLAFVDYEKAFDSIEFQPLFDALQNQGVDQVYISILKDLYQNATSVLRLHTDSDKFQLHRGARQGDNISPRLFTSCLQDAIISRINWENRGIKIDGEYLSHLIFADDIILIADSHAQLQTMLQDIHDTSKPVGLNMHLGKTKVMSNKFTTPTDIIVGGQKIEEVNNYIYLGQQITKDHDQTQEVKRRIGLGWCAFNKLNSIMCKRNVPMALKRKAFNECILPVLTYGSETWSLNNTQLHKLVITQRKMERIMVGVTLRDRKRASWIREQTKVIDIMDHIRGNKHRWAGHVCRRTDNRWTTRITEWCPRDHKRSRGRPKTRWRDELQDHIGQLWSRTAKDRAGWRSCREGFLRRERDVP